MSIPNNLRIFQQKIRECEKKFGLASHSVRLLAASKAQSPDKMLDAIQAGQKIFGENYLQEALSKMAVLSGHDLEWHFIGHIQNNKTRKIAENFSWVQSVPSSSIAKRLNDQRPPSLPSLNICLEINIDHEPLKSGVKPEEVFELAEYCLTLSRLKLRGLMAIPAFCENFTDQRKAFHQLRMLFDDLNKKNFALDTLSMGMTNDMEAAIAEGATLVRIGSGIFGERI